MQSAVFDVAERVATPSIRSRADLQAHYANSFTATVGEYVRIRQLSPVVAHQIDPNPVVRSVRLSYDHLDYVVDIERATEAALREKPELQRAWFQLALGEPVDTGLAQHCIQACGRVYAGRKLEPFRYYRRDRYPKRKGTR